MTWLFVQVWLWSLIAFVLGVAFAWLLLVRPLRARAARLEDALAQERARQEVMARQGPVPEGVHDEPHHEGTRFEPLDERFVDEHESEHYAEPVASGAEPPPSPRQDAPWLGGTGTDELPIRARGGAHLPERDEPAEREWPSPVGNGHVAPGSEPAWQADPDEAPQTSVIPIANLGSATRRPTFRGNVGEWPTVSPNDVDAGSEPVAPTAPGMPTPEFPRSGELETGAGPESVDTESVDAESTARVAPIEPPVPDRTQAPDRTAAEPDSAERSVPGWFQKPPEVEESAEPAMSAADPAVVGDDGASALDGPDPAEATETTGAANVDVPTEADAVEAAGITVSPDPDAAPLPRRNPGVGPRPGLQNLKARSEEGATPEEAVGSARAEGVPQSEGDVVKGHFASRRYHTPDSPYYDRIVAEAWFPDAEEAERAGFEPWDGWLRKRD